MFEFIKALFSRNSKLNEYAGNNRNYKKSKDAGEIYEDELYSQFGRCKEYTPFGINILFITDTHNCLAYTERYLNYLKSLKASDYDVCIILGDVSGHDINVIKNIVPDDKLYGIAGNHDSIDIMEANNISDINGKVIECKGARIGAIMGSNRYKQGDYGMLTDEESLEIAKSMESADILVSHDKAYILDKRDGVHDGLKGITYYLYKNHIPIHIHGHLHEEVEETLKNGTRSIGLFQIKLLSL